MKINIELTEKDLRRLVIEELQRLIGTVAMNPDFVRIQVKSKNNYKAEWEEAAFKATYTTLE